MRLVELKNGDLLHAVEIAGFDILVTTDRQLRYQQNLAARRIAIVVLSTEPVNESETGERGVY